MAIKMEIFDDSTASAYVGYGMSDIAVIYPVTSASGISEMFDAWASNGQKNIFGQTPLVQRLPSETGAVASVHDSLLAGSLVSTFTAPGDLLLMIPKMYKIARELLPAVFHVTGRSMAANALFPFGDHQDVMAVRQTGFGLLASASVQEVMDLGLVAHLAAVEGSIPFLHFYDRSETSHQTQNIEVIDYADMANLVNRDAVEKFRMRAANPQNGESQGRPQNSAFSFRGRQEASPYYMKIPTIVSQCMKRISKLTGRNYRLFDYTGHPKAERIIIAMASSCETIEETVRYMVAGGERVGAVKVRLYRPFSSYHFYAAVPASAKCIAVLDRTKESGSIGEPLYLDVCTAYMEFGEMPKIVGGRHGLRSEEFDPSVVKTIFDNLKSPVPKNHFTVGKDDEVHRRSLKVKESLAD